MKFVVVESLPEIDRTPEEANAKKKLKNYLDEFMKMNVKIVRVEYNSDEYKNMHSAHNAFYRARRRFGYPIDVYHRNGDIYLVRRDI